MYRLDAGTGFIETSAAPGVQRLRVAAPCRFAVLPDFFADDILVDAESLPPAGAELPSENFLLHMLPGGDAIVMTVSAARDDDVRVALSPGATGFASACPDTGEPVAPVARQIVATDVCYGKQPKIWIAVLAGRGIWHHRMVDLADADKTLDLDWKMPFAALWRSRLDDRRHA